jgi:alkylation response protein AidB-like acyl-CoA dehydrogenase
MIGARPVDLSLTPEEEQLVGAVRSLLRRESSPDRIRTSEKTGFDPGLWADLQRLGVPSMAAPDGNTEAAGLFQLALVAEQCGAALASAPVLEGIVATRLLGRCRHDAGELLASVCEGEVIATLSLALAATEAPNLIPAGAIAQLVLAMDGDDLVAVASKPSGVRIENLGCLPLGFWGPGAGARTVLATGSTARSAFAAALVDWKLLSAAQLTGLSAAALELGIDYAKSREVFGAPIATFQTIAHRLADHATAVDGARLLTYKAAWAVDEGRGDGHKLASMAWLFATETARDVTRDSLHYHGGYGFTAEYDIQLYFRKAKAFSLLWGDPRVEFRCLADLLFEPGNEFMSGGEAK